MEGICVGKGIAIGINLTFASSGCKKSGSCVYNETAEREGSLLGTLHVN